MDDVEWEIKGTWPYEYWVPKDDEWEQGKSGLWVPIAKPIGGLQYFIYDWPKTLKPSPPPLPSVQIVKEALDEETSSYISCFDKQEKEQAAWAAEKYSKKWSEPELQSKYSDSDDDSDNSWSSAGYYDSNVIMTLLNLFPGVANKTVPCPISNCSWKNKTSRPITDMIVHLNDQHHKSREEIADWLETLDIDLTLTTAQIGD